MTDSAVLLAFGLDAAVSAAAALVLAARIQHEWRNKFVAYAYMAASAISVGFGGWSLWLRQWPKPAILGIVLAAVSMLIIPIIGSYMKALAVELNPGFAGETLDGSIPVEGDLSSRVVANPSQYYVKLHSLKFPGGAIRGQLHPCE